MSFIVNPFSLRLGYSFYRNNVRCVSSKINYSFLTFLDENIFKYFSYLYDNYKWRSEGYPLLNTKIFRVFYKTYLLIFVRDQKKFVDPIHFHNFIYSFKLKKKIFFSLETYEKVNVDINNFITFFFEYKKNLQYFLFYKRYFHKYKRYFHAYFISLKQSNVYRLYDSASSILFNSNLGLIQQKFNVKLLFSFYNILSKYIMCLNFKIHCFYFFKKVDSNLQINIIIENSDKISALFSCNHIKLRLLQQYPIKHIIKTILSKLLKVMKNKNFNGVKISISGRFTRKDRKLYFWQNIGHVGFSNLGQSWPEYHCDTIVLTNSTRGIKVWLNKNMEKIMIPIVY